MRMVCAFGLLVLTVAASGCGSDDEDDANAAVEACHAYCETHAIEGCGDFATVEDCKFEACDQLEDVTDACTASEQLFYDCLTEQPKTEACRLDGIPSECMDQFDAAIDACAL